MATATYTVTRSDTAGTSDGLTEVWRKVQAGIVVAAQFGIEEWNFLQKLKNFKVNWSAREITVELDIIDDIGTTSIIEGGKEARPSSPSVVTATLTWILMNKRFTISKTAQYIQQQQGQRGQLESQLKYQSKKAVQGIRRKVGDMFYGYSSGTVALVNDSDFTSNIFTIDAMHGLAGLGDATEDHPVTDLFRVGDYVWILNPSGPAIRGTQPEAISAITPATPSLTLAATPASSADNDLIVFANNLENTTMASGSERNLHFIGLLDMLNTASIHGVTSGTYDRWASSTNNSDGGRFNGTKLRTLKQNIANQGGGKMDTVIWSNGVERDVIAQLQAGLRFSDAYAMEMDGDAKSKGLKFMTSRRVPDGYVFGFDSKNSVKKMVLLPEPGQQAFDDGHKLQDDSGLVFSLDYPAAMIIVNRGNFGAYSSVTQS